MHSTYRIPTNTKSLTISADLQSADTLYKPAIFPARENNFRTVATFCFRVLEEARARGGEVNYRQMEDQGENLTEIGHRRLRYSYVPKISFCELN